VAVDSAATLLEREPELAAFVTALSEAQHGGGRLVLIEAPAGLGKTSLLRAAADMAAQSGFTCLRARASELERDFAYGCVRQLLEHTVARAPTTERDRLFDGAAALSKPLFAPTGTLQRASIDSSFSMLHGLYWLLNNLAETSPVALAVDDLHWCDAESLRFLNYLAPRLDGLPLVLLASARSGQSTADLARLVTGPETTVLRPAPLSIGAIAAFCEQRLGARVGDEFAAACREATGGNPFFLEALVREADGQTFSVESIGPAAVAQAVLLRLSGAPRAATPLVRAVAVLGDGTSYADAADLAGLDEEEAARAADLLAALAILKPAERLEFTHPIVREAVYRDIGAHERAEAHARAARILAARGASEERIAAQLAEAEPAGRQERVELLRRVAADALGRGAPAAAAAWLDRALAEPPSPAAKPEVLLELGSAELRLGMPQAVEHLQAAVEPMTQLEQLATATRLLANAFTMSGEADRAVEAIESAVAGVAAGDRELSLLLEAELAAHAQEASLETRSRVAPRLARYGDLAGVTPGERFVLANLAFRRAKACESAAEAAAQLEHALAGGRLLGDQELDVAGTFYLLVVGLLATDALDVAHACLEQALADARERASIPAVAFVMVHRGWVWLRQGDMAQAEAEARGSLELLTTRDIPLGDAFARALLIEALIEMGELEAAEGELGGDGEIAAGLATNDLLRARGLLRAAQGRTREGFDDLVEFGRRDELWGGANPLASRWRSRAALALLALGDHEGARRLALDDLGRARRWGASSGIGIALRALALVEGGEASVDRLHEAVGVLERSPARLEHARALTDLGATLRRWGRRADARRVLTEGRDLAQGCAASALAERARTELRAAGGRSDDPEDGGVEQLTASELRVAELAAEGRSNPQIAQALFVTRKTVETHLGRVYRKLDIAGRADLQRVLPEPSRQGGA
jgi:DNA-binding CsgD family transcriptional regulator